MNGKCLRPLVVLFALFGTAALVASSDVRLPGNDRGYAPAQPIAFSHRLHAGELAIPCLYCHSGAERSRHAGIPEATLCMNCHKVVTQSFSATQAEKELAKAQAREPARILSPEISKLYRALALDSELRPDPAVHPQPIEWVRVHQLADFVYFDHRPHVARGIACETCHGPVQTMERMRQEATLSMGWCLACHRQHPVQTLSVESGSNPTGLPADHVSTDCATCHF